jgi:tetratricopeptide (TPR) repeat protein
MNPWKNKYYQATKASLNMDNTKDSNEADTLKALEVDMLSAVGDTEKALRVGYEYLNENPKAIPVIQSLQLIHMDRDEYGAVKELQQRYGVLNEAITNKSPPKSLKVSLDELIAPITTTPAHITRLLRTGGTEEALIETWQCLNNFPNERKLHCALATCFLEFGFYKEADDMYFSILDKCTDKQISDNRYLTRAYASAALMADNYGAAKERYIYAIELTSGDNIVTLCGLAQAYLGLKEYSKAKELLEKTVATYPYNIHVNIANFLQEITTAFQCQDRKAISSLYTNLANSEGVKISAERNETTPITEEMLMQRVVRYIRHELRNAVLDSARDKEAKTLVSNLENKQWQRPGRY